MQTKEYRTLDKSTWPPGPWQDEPDKVQWPDEVTGLPCLIVRGPVGALCGYVGVDTTHPWHGMGPNELPDHGLSVHGALNFAAACAASGDEALDICHIPDAGEPEQVWWFGFDCGQIYDVSPARIVHGFPQLPGSTYKDIAYVKKEVLHLAQQLAAAKAAA